MSNSQPFRWRTIIEIAVISIILYIVVGAPGLPFSIFESTGESEQNVPAARAKVESLVHPDPGLRCAMHDFTVHLLDTRPLVVYIEGFLTDDEAQHLIDISANKWQVSTVFNNGVETRDDSVRKSEKALIERDEVVQCVEQRALAFQGWPRDTFVERLWTQRYNTSGHYSYHYDWASGTKWSRRASTFMVYVGDECTGGGTHFPKLQMPTDERWCRFVECGRDVGEGVTFKAQKGNAVFWTNFDADGRGYEETIHAGMPVTSGTKVGLNIWSWYQRS